MRILLDHCVPARLRHQLSGHTVSTARQMGWQDLANGALLSVAESTFDVIVTVDRSIRHQQNLAGRLIAVLVIAAPNNRLKTLSALIPSVGRSCTDSHAEVVVGVRTVGNRSVGWSAQPV